MAEGERRRHAAEEVDALSVNVTSTAPAPWRCGGAVHVADLPSDASIGTATRPKWHMLVPCSPSIHPQAGLDARAAVAGAGGAVRGRRLLVHGERHIRRRVRKLLAVERERDAQRHMPRPAPPPNSGSST